MSARWWHMASESSTSTAEPGGALFERLLAYDNLKRALDAVVANDAADGAPTPGVRRLVAEGPNALQRLIDSVRGDTYEPRPPVALDVAKENGGVRRLAIPATTDRVLERALLQVLVADLDPLLGPTSFAFRPGLGVGDAVRAVVRLRDEGFGWVVHTDVHDCFESIARDRLRRLLATVIGNDLVLHLIDLWLERPVRHGDRLEWPDRGVPQGSPLSPLWCNLYLAEMDQKIVSAGHPLVRYADDLLVLARTRKEAQQAMELTTDAAAEIGLTLGDDKTEIIDFATGFCFVGEDFNRRYPPMIPDVIEPPDRKVLYAGVQGAYVSMRAGRVVVNRDTKELVSVPSGHVARIVSFGSVTLSPAVVSWALTSDVEVVLCSRRGGLLGTLSPAGVSAAATRRRQFECSDRHDVAVTIGAALEGGKIHNQRVLLQRRLAPETVDDLREPIAQLGSYLTMLSTAASREEVLGIEGIAARTYFGALRALLPRGLDFNGRVTRPPGDVVNAALGYGYAILVGECATALAAAGLDPTIGLLHVDRGSRVSLALDLVEEFRPVVVDSVVVAMARGGELRVEHGRPVQAGKGVLLTDAGRISLVTALERRLLTRVFHLASDRKVSYRRAIYMQAQSLARVVAGTEDQYDPMLWRV